MKGTNCRIALAICLFGLAFSTQAAKIDIGVLVQWSCPGPATGGPATDASGDRLYLRVVDSQGNDLEVWCMQTGLLGRHRYEYWVSFRNGNKTKVSQCELTWGNNKNTITVKGNQGKTVGRVPGGGKSIRYKGRFGTFKHHNFNSSEDFHFTYDYATRKWHRYNTEKYRDSKGVKREKNTSFDDGQFSFVNPLTDFLPDNQAFVAASFPAVASEEYQREAAGCEVAYDAEYQEPIVASVLRLNTNGAQEMHGVIYPSDIEIEDIWFEEIDQALKLSLSESNERAEIQLTIPQGLLANQKAGDLVINLDGEITNDLEQIINDKATIITVNNAQQASMITIESQVDRAAGAKSEQRLNIWMMVSVVLAILLVSSFIRKTKRTQPVERD